MQIREKLHTTSWFWKTSVCPSDSDSHIHLYIPCTRAERGNQCGEKEKQALPWLSSSISAEAVAGQPRTRRERLKPPGNMSFFPPDWFSAWLCLLFSPTLTVSRSRCVTERWVKMSAVKWMEKKKERENTSGCRLNRGLRKRNIGGDISEVSDRDVRDWPLRFSLLLHPQLLRLHSH